jgi:hypothetical protein
LDQFGFLDFGFGFVFLRDIGLIDMYQSTSDTNLPPYQAPVNWNNTRFVMKEYRH